VQTALGRYGFKSAAQATREINQPVELFR